ncbi:MAG: glycosyltransferase family 2 protein [bacterium]
MKKKASVIFTTYNQPEWLRKVLWGYECQTINDFEIVIADDGSGPDTRAIIDGFKEKGKLNITHVWHPDEGYQKCPVLNKAILASTSDYLIFSDGDCIPRNDFVETHLKFAKKNYFLSGGTLRLPIDISKSISIDDIKSQNCFDLQWLLSKGMRPTFKISKLVKSKTFSSFMNFLTPTNASWNGHNSSGWKTDLIGVNGFNEDMHYGGQDRELGERLQNLGIKSKQIRYSAVCIHLEHGRPYMTKESIRKNRAIRDEVKKNNIIKTPNGIDRH